MQAPRSGWYPDPQVPDQMRFWDGSAWTEQSYALQARLHPVGYRFAVLAQVIRTGLILSLAIGVAEIALYAWGLSMFDTAIANGDVERLSRFDNLNKVLTIGEAVLFVVTGIVWMFWQYQLARSARPGELERSPRMHVGSWFIPLANLVLVFQNVRDLWRHFVGTRTSLLGWWWATMLLANFVIRLGTPDENDYSISSLRTEVSFWTASSVLDVVAAALALVMRPPADLRRSGEVRSWCLRQPDESGLAPADQVGPLGLVLDQSQRQLVRRPRLVVAAQPAQQVGAGGVQGVVAGQLEPVDDRQRDLGPVQLGDRDGPVQRDDR